MRTLTFRWLVLQALASIINLLLRRGSTHFHSEVAQACLRECALLRDFQENEDKALENQAHRIGSID